MLLAAKIALLSGAAFFMWVGGYATAEDRRTSTQVILFCAGATFLVIGAAL